MKWIDEAEALAIHAQLIRRHGGATGIRDLTLLASALARPRQRHAYDRRSDLAALAASYTAAIVKNHPFLDGNKRTGFVLGVLFLELNGSTFQATESDAAASVLALAGGNMDEDTYARFLRANIS